VRRTATARSVTGVCELTLETYDRAAMESFYREGFGFEVLSRTDDRTWLGVTQDCRLGLWTPGPKEFGDEGGAHVHFAFAVSPGTLDDMARRVRELSPNVRGPEEHEGGDRSLYVEDPEGNVLELWDYFHREDGRDEGVDGLRS
jgi:catechol-2,3-dioxygenase